MSTPEQVVLRFVVEAAERRRRTEGEFRAALVAAWGADIPLPVIAQAAGLSVSRVHAIVQEKRKESTMSLAHAHTGTAVPDEPDVVVVAAGRAAADEYLAYGAYVCQVGRSFKDVDRMGFYRRRAIEPYFPRILHRLGGVEFTHANAVRLRSTGVELTARIADVVDGMLDDGRRSDGEVHDVFLLSQPDDPVTLVLPAPIRHSHVGRGSAWTQGQRYTTEAALLAGPLTTDDLN